MSVSRLPGFVLALRALKNLPVMIAILSILYITAQVASEIPFMLLSDQGRAIDCAALAFVLLAVGLGVQERTGIQSPSASAKRYVLTFVSGALAIIALLWNAEFFGYTNGNGGWGALPANDAEGHYWGSLGFSQTWHIDSWVGRRPLSVFMNTFVNYLAGFDPYRYGTIMLVASFGSACITAFSSRYVLPTILGPLVMVGIMIYALGFYMPMLSANSGLILSCIGTALFCIALNRRDLLSLVLATGVLSVALYIRPGPLFFLPTLGLLGFFILEKRREKLLWLPIGVVCCNLGVILSLVTLYFVGEVGVSSFNENAYETLFGFVTAKDWTYLGSLYPEYNSMTLDARRTFALEKIVEAVGQNPWAMLQEAAKNIEKMARLYFGFHFVECDMREIRSVLCVGFLKGEFLFFLLSGLLLHLFAFLRNDYLSIVFISIGLALFLSAGVMFGDGGSRAFSVMWPIFVILSLYGFWLLKRVLTYAGNAYSNGAGQAFRKRFWQGLRNVALITPNKNLNSVCPRWSQLSLSILACLLLTSGPIFATFESSAGYFYQSEILAQYDLKLEPLRASCEEPVIVPLASILKVQRYSNVKPGKNILGQWVHLESAVNNGDLRLRNEINNLDAWTSLVFVQVRKSTKMDRYSIKQFIFEEPLNFGARAYDALAFCSQGRAYTSFPHESAFYIDGL